MHVPDGHPDPKTCAPAYAVMAPFRAIASAKLNESLFRKTHSLAQEAVGC